MSKIKIMAVGGLGAVAALVLFMVALASASSTSTIDFEGLAEGLIVTGVTHGSGISGFDAGGSVGVNGFNPDFPLDNTAMIFDATCAGGCSGGDVDLEFPLHGNVLIISEDKDGTDPDDADKAGAFYEFDFSGWGTGSVTVESIDVMDVEGVEGGAIVELFSDAAGTVSLGTIAIPITGDNAEATLAINVSGVVLMRVGLNGSGAIDNIEIEAELARITGGGWRVPDWNGDTVRSSNGLTLHCDETLSNNLQINWQDGGSNKWHIDKFVDEAFCYNHPLYTPEPPAAPADTYVGLDVGRLNNVDGSLACFILADHGEKSGDLDGPDEALIRVWDTTLPEADRDTIVAILVAKMSDLDFDCTVDEVDIPEDDPFTVLFVPLFDVKGNLQFHFDQPHKNKGP